MRKIVSLLLVVVLVMGFVGMVSAEEPVIPEFPVVYTLYAGQSNDIGEVRVWNDEDNLFVEFWTKSGYRMTETHLHVASSKEGLPTNKSGNPVPGHFEFSRVHKPAVNKTTYTVPLDGIAEGKKYFIAAHAAVGSVMSGTIVSDEKTLFYDGANWVSSVESFSGHPVWVSFKNSNPILADSTWRWSMEYVDAPTTKQSYDFKREFSINGYPLEGTLYITTDNAFSADLNGEFVGADGTWNTLKTYDVTELLISGGNILEVEATNFVGVNSPLQNPAGLIYRLDYTYVNPTSAWGATGVGENRFVTRGNWATYFCYEVPAREVLVETVFVNSTSAVGVTTNTVLEDGQVYKLKASGTFTYNNAGDWADAEWYLRNGVIVKGDTEGSVPHVLDVSISGYVANIDWGAYNPAHVYYYNFTGTGSTVRFFIHDSFYGDNSGGITVEIFKVN